MRFGLLGTGHWAEVTQGAALAAHREVELVGVWGRDPVKADTLAGKLGARGYHDVDLLLADVDAIAVALPPDVQAPLARRAAEAGRHLLLDKPLSLTVPEADQVVAAVEKAGVASAIFFTSRYDPVVTQALNEAAAQEGWSAGRVTMFASIFHQDSPYAQSSWRRLYGGLWDIGPHALSRLLPVLGPVMEVSAFAGSHATSHVLLRHAGGAVSTMALTLDAPPAAVKFESELYGAAGVRELPGGSVDAVTAFGTAIDELLAQVRSGSRDHPCDVRFGRDVVAILAAAARSQLDGRAVSL